MYNTIINTIRTLTNTLINVLTNTLTKQHVTVSSSYSLCINCGKHVDNHKCFCSNECLDEAMEAAEEGGLLIRPRDKDNTHPPTPAREDIGTIDFDDDIPF